MTVDSILLQQNQCYIRSTTWVTWRAVCSCFHKNEHGRATGNIFAGWGVTSNGSRSSPWRFMHPGGSWCGKPSMTPPQSFRKQRHVAQFQESEVNFGWFGHFDQIGGGGEIKIPLGSKAHFHFYSGVESEFGLEFLLVNPPQLWSRTKTRGCMCPQLEIRQPNVPGNEWLFSRGCFFIQSFLLPGNPFDILGSNMSVLLSSRSNTFGQELKFGSWGSPSKSFHP